ncbi:MAG: hypothetical protein Ct9H300mP1_09810 [Planctomycetaceae bacterium]|nr:MAG: hypothetical protein Ct9H300mP1_09810 [Planctomycetaceae bacterium]
MRTCWPGVEAGGPGEGPPGGLGLALGWLGYGLVGDAAAPVFPRRILETFGRGRSDLAGLLLLAVTIGWPYFVLSTTGPLLQAW